MRILFIFLLLVQPIFAAGLSPEVAQQQMKLPEGFTTTIVAHEPMIRQPLSMEFDERGRLWVLQYLQYPNPAGLKAVKQDQYLRTIWDRVPEPPPKGPKGIDRITILSKPDATGKYTEFKDFLNDLNLATGFCLGNNGVYVVQPPYLLFYADQNHDDQPDGDPTVLLSGFGMEDTHSYANSLQFGPDGWLYGAHGSTVTAKIKNPAKPEEPVIEFQQGIWRYHPVTKRFELFAEGGGNTYGLDFDQFGRCIAGTNYGGAAMLHQVQGAYYVKGFAKHGPLHNPNTYGYFDHVPYDKFKGGHVTCGGVVYQADRYPAEMQNQYIAGNLLSNAIYWHKMQPKGSSFTATHGGDLMTTEDIWFRPVDCFQGPDGCIYVADWYDKRAAHLDPVDTWDKTSGRIYRIDYKQPAQLPEFDLRKKTSQELCDLLEHPNKWYRNVARRLLGERRDKSVLPRLHKQVQQANDRLNLESLWAANLIEPISDELFLANLNSKNEHLRAWLIRLIGDRYTPQSPLAEQNKLHQPLMSVATNEKSPTVRSQLACTARRLGKHEAIPIAYAMAERMDDLTDPHIPHLIWWAIEEYMTHPRTIIDTASHQSAVDVPWEAVMFKKFLAERFARRTVAADLKRGDLADTVTLLKVAKKSVLPELLKGINAALDGQPAEPKNKTFFVGQESLLQAAKGNVDLERLLIRFNHDAALDRVHLSLKNSTLPDADVLKTVQYLGQLRWKESLPVLQHLFRTSKSDPVRSAAMLAVVGYQPPEFINEIWNEFPKMTGSLRSQALTLLFSKPETTLQVLTAVDGKKIDSKSIPVEQLRPVTDFKNEQIDQLILKHWGKIGAATPGEKQARITWLNIILSRGTGNKSHGKELFTKHCATCHQLFGEGQKIGPDLTTADRKNRGYLLAQIVDPSGYVRPEYVSFNVTTNSGRRLSGLVQDPTDTAVTLVNMVENKPVKTTVAKTDIDQMLPSAISLMPEKILDTFGDDDVRDLFAYLQTEAPVETPKNPPKAGLPKLKVLLVSGSLEYKSDASLDSWAKHLEATGRVEIIKAYRKTDTDIPGLIDGLAKCDVAVFYTRRLKIDGEQLDAVKKFTKAGKPMIGIRTASHGFQNWLAMDKEVFGGDYGNHYGHDLKTAITFSEAGKKHEILNRVSEYQATGGLYKNANVNKDVTVLMTGTIPGHTEPITWTRELNSTRIFYTSLGHPSDFENPQFVTMLTNALWWVTKSPVPKK